MQKVLNSQNSDLVIFPGTLIDNVEQVARANAAVLIRNGLIHAVRFDLSPENCQGRAEVLIRPELTLLPAMLDCHVHLALDGQDFHAAQLRWQEEQAWQKEVQAELKDCLQCGIGVLRDGGDQANIGLRAKRLVEEGIISGPRILACGQAIGKKGRYGSFLGPGVTSAAEACQMLDKLRGQGADWVKVLVSGIVSFKEYERVGEVQFSPRELDYIVKYARSIGLPVMAHASSEEAVAMAARAGVDSLEHGYFISTRSLHTLAEQGIPWVPTVVPVANQTRPPANQVHSDHSIEIITRTYELQLAKIHEASELGVNLGIGTDAGAFGVLHGYSVLEELELFQRAGLAPVEIVKAATLNAARICGVATEYGTIQSGKKACLLGVRGNPYQDSAALAQAELLVY